MQRSYQGMSCRGVHGGQLSDHFEVKTGMRQGCLLLPLLSTLVVYWIMRTSTEGRKNGIQWTLWSQLDDLDFADDLAFLSHSNAQMQNKTTCLDSTSARISLHINNGKTKIIRMQQASDSPVTVVGQLLEEVNSFSCLGSMVDTLDGTDADVRARIGKARSAFLILKTVWGSREIEKSTKRRIFNTNVKSVLCESQTWRTTQATLQKLQTFINIYRQSPRYPAAREEKQQELVKQIKNQWLHRSVEESSVGVVTPPECLPATSPGRLWPGINRGRERWEDPGTQRRDIEAKMLKSCHCWNELEKTAQSKPLAYCCQRPMLLMGQKPQVSRFTDCFICWHQGQG